MTSDSDIGPRAGWSVEEFARLTNVGRTTLFMMEPKELRPRSVKVLKRRIITEPPSAWLQRLGAAQAVAGDHE